MITFGDDAFEAMVRVAQAIHEGYTVAILGKGEGLPETGEIVIGTDVQWVKADHLGVTYRILDMNANVIGDPLITPWDQIDRIHVY